MCKRILTLAWLVTFGACGSDGDQTSTTPMAGAAGDEAPLASEACPPSTPAFTTGPAGLTAKDAQSGISVRIDTAPNPPQRTFNDWKIVVTDASGAAVPNAQLSWACAWMAVHGHGTNPKKVMSAGNGVFNLMQQNFSMYGPWEVRLWIDPTGKAPAYAPQSVSGVENGDACTPSNGGSPTANIKFDFCVPRTSDD